MNKDFFLEQKLKLLKRILVIMAIVILVLGLTRLYEKNYLYFIVDALFSLMLSWGYLKLRGDSGSFYFVARIMAFFSFAMILYLLTSYHESPIRFIWFPTVVYLIFYVFDKKEGRIWALSYVVMLFGIFFYDRSLLDIEPRDFYIWFFNVLVVLLVINMYEGIKEKFTQNLLNTQQVLAEEVALKTAELRTLNEELERRIEEKSKQVRYQEQMTIRQSRQAQMGEMLSMIAHQWRQPLTAISATSSLIELKARTGNLDPEVVLKGVKSISSYAQHLSTTINDFRDFSKSNKELKETSYAELVKSVLRLIESTILDKNIQVYQSFDEQNKFVSYPNELKQVILNLIKNAEDVLLEKKIQNPLIRLVSYYTEDKYILEVSDNGGGIPEEIVGNIFDLYFSTKKEKNGTGLGLYMSRVIIEEHCGGELSVENIENGALFRITLY